MLNANLDFSIDDFFIKNSIESIYEKISSDLFTIKVNKKIYFGEEELELLEITFGYNVMLKCKILSKDLDKFNKNAMLEYSNITEPPLQLLFFTFYRSDLLNFSIQEWFEQITKNKKSDIFFSIAGGNSKYKLFDDIHFSRNDEIKQKFEIGNFYFKFLDKVFSTFDNQVFSIKNLMNNKNRPGYSYNMGFKSAIKKIDINNITIIYSSLLIIGRGKNSYYDSVSENTIIKRGMDNKEFCIAYKSEDLKFFKNLDKDQIKALFDDFIFNKLKTIKTRKQLKNELDNYISNLSKNFKILA